jgi:hypothetical protein
VLARTFGVWQDVVDALLRREIQRRGLGVPAEAAAASADEARPHRTGTESQLVVEKRKSPQIPRRQQQKS